jgi:hypothetical protein
MPDDEIPLTPQLGEHTDSVMREVLGYDDATIEGWKADGILV